MISILGDGVRLCDRLSRREWLRLGGLTAFGLGMPAMSAARFSTAPDGFGRARACIVLWMSGGPPQHETWDPKPEAPAEIRGPCSPIRSKVPGIIVGEWMPRVAAMLDKICVLRAVFTNNPSHPGSGYEMMTGRLHPLGKGRDDVVASPADAPCLGAIVNRLRTARPGVPTAVTIPEPFFNVPFYPGQDAGFLGHEWHPWRLTCDPSAADFKVPEFALPADITAQRLGSRRDLITAVNRGFDRLERSQVAARHERNSSQVYDLLLGNRCRRAFDLSLEAPSLRDRYGRHKFGQSCLLARRLIEAGVTLVQVNWHRETNEDNPMWDAHANLEDRLKNALMPPMDRGYSALLEDLDQRGLLDQTLVVWMGEFGRTPKLETIRPPQSAGRNHWGDVFSIALAGGGVRGGQVFGASDKIGGYPKDGPVGPADLTATVFHSLGLSPDALIRDRLDRPLPISTGKVIQQIL